MAEINIGVDIGNYDVKTQWTSTPSSYQEYDIEPLLEKEILYFDGKYYSPTKERNNHQDNKMNVDGGKYLLIMTLLGIAKEIATDSGLPIQTQQELQKEISKHDIVNLGVGLPVGHFSRYSKQTKTYYEEHFKKGISFGFKGDETGNKKMIYNIKVNQIGVFPQDVIAVVQNPSLSIPRDYKSYYIIGWGGGTLDVIPIKDGVPAVSECESLKHGSTELYSIIARMIKTESDIEAEYGLIEDVLMDKKTVLDDRIQQKIKKLANMYVEKTVDELIHKGMKFNTYPTVFVGGASLLLKKYITQNKAFAKIEIVQNVNENAIYYAKAI